MISVFLFCIKLLSPPSGAGRPGQRPGECGTAYSRTRCLPSLEEISLHCVPACGEDFTHSIPSGSHHKAKGRLCGGPGEVGLRPNGAFLHCPHPALPRGQGGARLHTLAHSGRQGANTAFQGLGGVPSPSNLQEGHKGPYNAKPGGHALSWKRVRAVSSASSSNCC